MTLRVRSVGWAVNEDAVAFLRARNDGVR